MSSPSKSKGGRKGKVDDDIISVEETVWSLKLGPRSPPCNVARFEEVWIGKGANKRKVTRPPFDDPTLFTKPAYMYREQEVEDHSEDEDYEGPVKTDPFERPAFKRRVIKSRGIQWTLEDQKEFAQGGFKYTGEKTIQNSKYAIFRVQDQEIKTIEVTPISEWWHFKRPARDDGKMTVKEAEELMKMQENFVGPLSLANKLRGKGGSSPGLDARDEADGKVGDLDREDAQVLREAGVALAGADDGGTGRAVGGDDMGDGDDGWDLEDGDGGSQAGGEDDDFGDEIRSDDEEEVGNDDANQGGGTLHQDDESLNGTDDDLDEDEHSELQKLSRTVNAEEEEGPVVTGVSGDVGPTSPVQNVGVTPAGADTNGSGNVAEVGAPAPSGGTITNGSSSKRGASSMGADVANGKRAKISKNLSINQQNVVMILKRFGGRLSSKRLLTHFVSELKVNGVADKAALARLGEILKKVATKVDDAIDGKVWILKSHYS